MGAARCSRSSGKKRAVHRSRVFRGRRARARFVAGVLVVAFATARRGGRRVDGVERRAEDASRGRDADGRRAPVVERRTARRGADRREHTPSTRVAGVARGNRRVDARRSPRKNAGSGDRKQILSAHKAHEVLRNVSDSDARLLGLDPRHARPEWLLPRYYRCRRPTSVPVRAVRRLEPAHQKTT